MRDIAFSVFVGAMTGALFLLGVKAGEMRASRGQAIACDYLDDIVLVPVPVDASVLDDIPMPAGCSYTAGMWGGGRRPFAVGDCSGVAN